MPFVTHRGQRLHYAVEGSGPLIVLQHGAFLDGRSWAAAGFVDGLSDGYRVAYIDSLGHGLSDKPDDPTLYAQDQRAGDIVAVMDDLGAERAHVVGHSMGGWIGVGMAKYYPSRLASLTVGSWDIVSGVASALPQGMSFVPFERMLAGARAAAPALLAWVTPQVEPGLRACWDALRDLDGAGATVLALDAPVLLWNGREDPYHAPMQAFAAEHGLRFLSAPGDHLGAVLLHGVESARGVRAFVDAAADIDRQPLRALLEPRNDEPPQR
jgi:pimeloyl-ACP methyl ester carboxylesterase